MTPTIIGHPSAVLNETFFPRREFCGFGKSAITLSYGSLNIEASWEAKEGRKRQERVLGWGEGDHCNLNNNIWVVKHRQSPSRPIGRQTTDACTAQIEGQVVQEVT